jgi:hypothetical protein
VSFAMELLVSPVIFFVVKRRALRRVWATGLA